MVEKKNNSSTKESGNRWYVDANVKMVNDGKKGLWEILGKVAIVLTIFGNLGWNFYNRKEIKLAQAERMQDIVQMRNAGNEYLYSASERLKIIDDVESMAEGFEKASRTFHPSDSVVSRSAMETAKLILRQKPELTNPKTEKEARRRLAEKIVKDSTYHRGFPKRTVYLLRESSEAMGKVY